MSDQFDRAERFVGTSVHWGRLATTMVVSFIFAWFTGAIDFVFNLVSGPSRLISGIFEFFRVLVTRLFAIGETAISEGFAAAAREFPLGVGPLEWMVGVLVVVVWLWLMSVAWDRLQVRA